MCALASFSQYHFHLCIPLASLTSQASFYLIHLAAQHNSSAGRRGKVLCALTLKIFFACLPIFSIEEGRICCLTLCLHPVWFMILQVVSVE